MDKRDFFVGGDEGDRTPYLLNAKRRSPERSRNAPREKQSQSAKAAESLLPLYWLNLCSEAMPLGLFQAEQMRPKIPNHVEETNNFSPEVGVLFTAPVTTFAVVAACGRIGWCRFTG